MLRNYLETREAELAGLRRKSPITLDLVKDRIGFPIANHFEYDDVPFNEVIDEWFASARSIFLNGVCLANLLEEFTPDQARSDFLIKVWKEHLLQSLPSESQSTYIFWLRNKASSASLHGALNRAHNKRFNEVDSLEYTGASEELYNSVVHSYFVEKGILQLTDMSAINALTFPESYSPQSENDEEQTANLLYEMETQVQFVVNDRVVPEVNILSQKVTIYEQEVFERLLKPAAELMRYAFSYIEKRGHTQALSEALLNSEDYFNIRQCEPIKNNHSSYIPGKASSHHEADKIFTYIAKNFPSFVDNLLAHYELAQVGEEEFVYYLKLLYRLSLPTQTNLVDLALAQYSKTMPANAGVLSIREYNETSYREIYRTCKTNHYFRVSMTATEVVDNAAKSITNYIAAKVAELEVSKRSNFINTSIFGYSQSRGLCRAHTYQLLLEAAPTAATKYAIIICLLKDNSTKILKQQMLEEIRPHTQDSLYDLLPVMNDTPDHKGFNRRYIEPIITAANNVKTFNEPLSKELIASVESIRELFIDPGFTKLSP